MASIKTTVANDAQPADRTAPIDIENNVNLSHEACPESWVNVEYTDMKLLQSSPLFNRDVSFDVGPLRTSTPDPPRSSSDRRYHSVRIVNGVDPRNSTFSSSVTCVGAEEIGADTSQKIEVLNEIQVPIVGYETIEERAKFTVFKLEVKKNSLESWYIFRRYSDFERLKRQVRRVFPDAKLSLPPKKWFGDNFETVFLDERMAGLQIFIKNIFLNKDVNNCAPVRQFFCFDEPPGPYESLEESRATCESLEDQVYRLTVQLQERDDRIESLEAELKQSREKISEMERASCSCGSSGAPATKLAREVDSNENLTEQS